MGREVPWLNSGRGTTLVELNRKPRRLQGCVQWSLQLYFLSLRSVLSAQSIQSDIRTSHHELGRNGLRGGGRLAIIPVVCPIQHGASAANAALLKWEERESLRHVNNFIPQTSKMKLPS